MFGTSARMLRPIRSAASRRNGHYESIYEREIPAAFIRATPLRILRYTLGDNTPPLELELVAGVEFPTTGDAVVFEDAAVGAGVGLITEFGAGAGVDRSDVRVTGPGVGAGVGINVGAGVGKGVPGVGSGAVGVVRGGVTFISFGKHSKASVLAEGTTQQHR